MKLQAQYNKVTVSATLIVLVIAAIGYYFLLHYVLINQLDESLKVEEVEIQDYIKKNNKLPEATVYKDQRIAFQKTNHQQRRSFQSLSAFHPGENKMRLSRQLLFTVTVNGEQYTASVTKSEEATENLVWIILFSTIALLILLTAILFFTNRLLMKKLWKPFHHTLSSIKEFNLSAPGNIPLHATKITEFGELNESIRLMAQKVKKDYQSLKSFTDHASHELQTPLAIITSKLDGLIQEPELTEKSMQQIQGIYNAVEKLSRLSQSLLLLTKIEHHHFTGKEAVSIKHIADEKINEMEEWIQAAQLTVQAEGTDPTVMIDKDLAGIMVSNLLRNAIQHSRFRDTIHIETGADYLTVSNPGTAALDSNQIFDRFNKGGNSTGNGLGLSIVQQICEQYGFHCSYSFIGDQHIFRIKFI